jgi:hypothetical protein
MLKHVLIASLFLAPTSAWACATCACGDPTLTSMGTEQPFAGRLRLATTVRAWGLTTGVEGEDAIALRELRMDVSAAYAPTPWLFLSATLPLQAREVRDVSLARETAWGVGDLEVSARATVFRDRAFSPNHMVSVLAGVKLPTAPLQYTLEHQPLSLDAQLGSGSLDPFAGLAYTAFGAPWALVASVTGYHPTRGHEGFRAGASVRTTLAAQFQPSPRWALRLATDTRLEALSDTRGERSRHGGGFIAFLSPDVLFSPVTDVVVEVGVRLPVLNLLGGSIHPTPILHTALAYDL